MEIKSFIEGIAVLTMPVTSIALIVRAYFQKDRLDTRAIQLAALGMIAPLLLILSLEGSLEHQALGTLIGGMMGYALSGVGGRGAAPPTV